LSWYDGNVELTLTTSWCTICELRFTSSHMVVGGSANYSIERARLLNMKRIFEPFWVGLLPDITLFSKTVSVNNFRRKQMDGGQKAIQLKTKTGHFSLLWKKKKPRKVDHGGTLPF